MSAATMEFNYPPQAEAYREKVRAFLAENLPAGWKEIGRAHV